MVDLIVFIIAAIITIGGALGVVFFRNPVRAALSLVATFFSVALLFIIQGANFLGFVQVVVYAGAIVVLFLFVIMLLGVDKAQEVFVEPLAGQRSLGFVAAGTFLVMSLSGLFLSGPLGADNASEDAGAVALTGQIGRNPIDETPDVSQLAGDIFSRNLVAFQATALLLTIATIGAVVMVKNSRRIDELSLAGAGKGSSLPVVPAPVEKVLSSPVESKDPHDDPEAPEITEHTVDDVSQPEDTEEFEAPDQEDSLINFEDLDGKGEDDE